MPSQTHLPESLTIPKPSVSPLKTSAPLEVPPPKEPREMAGSKKPESSSQTGKVPERSWPSKTSWPSSYPEWPYVPYEISPTQDKIEVMKVQALTTVCAGDWSSMLNILAIASIISRPIFCPFPIVNFKFWEFLHTVVLPRLWQGN